MRCRVGADPGRLGAASQQGNTNGPDAQQWRVHSTRFDAASQQAQQQQHHELLVASELFPDEAHDRQLEDTSQVQTSQCVRQDSAPHAAELAGQAGSDEDSNLSDAGQQQPRLAVGDDELLENDSDTLLHSELIQHELTQQPICFAHSSEDRGFHQDGSAGSAGSGNMLLHPSTVRQQSAAIDSCSEAPQPSRLHIASQQLRGLSHQQRHKRQARQQAPHITASAKLPPALQASHQEQHVSREPSKLRAAYRSQFQRQATSELNDTQLHLDHTSRLASQQPHADSGM